MFDVGFWELVMIGVVALVVVGPERLPRMARVAGLWLGRARRVLGSVKQEIDRELKADELKEILRKQAQSNPLQRILEEPARPSARPAAQTASPSEASAPATQSVASSNPTAPGSASAGSDPRP